MVSLDALLATPKTVAIIGLSDKPNRYSFQVAQYLLSQGFTVIPVNPNITNVFGINSYKSFSDILQSIHIDIVDIFRNSDEVMPLIEEIITSGRKPIIWFQLGSENVEAQNLAQANGFKVISGVCLMKVHQARV